jgi:hypothetical protein
LDGNLSSILIGSRKDEEAIDWSKGLGKLSLDKGNKLKEVMEAYQGREDVCVFGKKGEGRGELSVRKVVSSCVWRCSWKGYGKK